jgi:arylsulfatase A-like enzyme
MAGTTTSGSLDMSDLGAHAIRMVIPLRREFGCSLDVQHFLHDFAYAHEILEKAKASRDERLRDCAAYLESKMLGPRNAHPHPPLARPATGDAASHPEHAETEEELRAKMMSKYRNGLR